MPVTAEIEAIEEVHDALGLTYRQIATVLKADESTLHRWRAGESEPSPIFADRLDLLDEFLREVRGTFRHMEAARSWLERRVPAFGNRRPLDLLLQGRLERLTAELVAFNTGMTT